MVSEDVKAPQDLQKSFNWQGAFWIVMGVPPICLITLGGVSVHAGNVAYAVWIVSAFLAFFQCFVYAEIAVMFPHKAGGASIHSAAAWFRYGKFLAPVAVWCNWISWSPFLSLGCAIAAAYFMNAIFHFLPLGDIAYLTSWSLWSWRVPFFDVGMALNVRFFVAVCLMSLITAVQLRSIAGTVTLHKVMGLLALLPLALAAILPFFLGNIQAENYVPFLPLREPSSPVLGAWDHAGMALLFGALFLAGWSTYGFEVVTYYTREFKSPSTDTVKGLLISGLVCMAVFILLPLSFQGVLGLDYMLDEKIVDGTGIAKAIGTMLEIPKSVMWLFEGMMAMTLLLAVSMAVASSARCLYQGSKDGWLPRYLGKLNGKAVPARAIWTDYGFNVVLLMIACADAASFYGVLAVSNCTYFILKFLNLNACWIYRLDFARRERAYKVGRGLLLFSIFASFANIFIMGAGAKVWHPNALWFGFVATSLVIPMFWYRHVVEDKKILTKDMRLWLFSGEKRAGILPYATIGMGLALAIFAHYGFRF